MSLVTNNVKLIGNVGGEPELKTFESGKTQVKLSIATSKTYKNKSNGQTITTTYWHNLIAWGKLAEIINNTVGKGHELTIEGELTNRKYTDNKGVERQITEIILSSFHNHTSYHLNRKTLPVLKQAQSNQPLAQTPEAMPENVEVVEAEVINNDIPTSENN